MLNIELKLAKIKLYRLLLDKEEKTKSEIRIMNELSKDNDIIFSLNIRNE